MSIKKLYPHGFPPCYKPKKLTIYEVPIFDATKCVYMKPNFEFPSYPVITVCTELFLEIWKNKESSPHSWKNDMKINSCKTDKYFSYGINNPVPCAVVHFYEGNELHLLDGITRTIWLLLHKAKAFPLACPPQYAYELRNKIGVEESKFPQILSHPRDFVSFLSFKLKKFF